MTPPEVTAADRERAQKACACVVDWGKCSRCERMATTLATVRADDASELEACRRIAGYDNGIALLQERDTLQARVLTLEAALREIRDGRLPQVCALYELCTHEGCAASYAAFAIAENALAPGAGGPP